jgi:ketosteroid isomerase-like protein
MFGMPDRRIAIRALAACAAAMFVAACAAPPTASPADKALLTQQVADTERAFAKTMAERDLAAFASFVADEAVFFDGTAALRGKAAVLAAWKPLFTAPTAPFSWAPEQVEVLPSGTIALSSGPVFAPSGKKVASFTSIWRLDAPGVWRIVFDKGCDCPPP